MTNVTLTFTVPSHGFNDQLMSVVQQMISQAPDDHDPKETVLVLEFLTEVNRFRIPEPF